jgi:hypothetical protein
MKALITRNRRALRISPTMLICHQIIMYQEPPLRRNVMSTMLFPKLLLGFPPVHEGEWARGTPDTLQDRKEVLVDVTASVSRRLGFLKTTK